MSSNTLQNPLIGPPPAEVPLAHAPLERVIAQVRFPAVLALALAEPAPLVARFQEAIRGDYPILRGQRSVAVQIGSQGVIGEQAGQVWQFHAVDGSWYAALGTEFLALVCTRYTSRADFFRRWLRLLAALGETVGPAQVDRLGVRYVDRVRLPAPSQIGGLVRKELAGLLDTELAQHTSIGLSEHVFELPEDAGARLCARWGWLPPQQTYEASAVAPDPSGSWLLDLDAFRGATEGFDPEELCAGSRAFAERIYTFFRWSVTDEFLRRFGGQPCS